MLYYCFHWVLMSGRFKYYIWKQLKHSHATGIMLESCRLWVSSQTYVATPHQESTLNSPCGVSWGNTFPMTFPWRLNVFRQFKELFGTFCKFSEDTFRQTNCCQQVLPICNDAMASWHRGGPALRGTDNKAMLVYLRPGSMPCAFPPKKTTQ